MPLVNLTESLRRTGLTEYESEAYLALLSKRELTAEEIASRTSIPITRVYATLEQLSQKGFAGVIESRPKRFRSISPGQARRQYLTYLRRNFESNFLTVEETLAQLQRQVEPLYVESHLQVKAEELLEPLEDLRNMEKRTNEYIKDAQREILISTALFSWLPKIKLQLRNRIVNHVDVRILMQTQRTQVGRHLAELIAEGAQIRDTKDPWHPFRGTLVDGKDLLFLTWAAEESERHWNPIVYTPHHSKNPGFIRIFRESFEHRWSNAKRVTAIRLAQT